MNRTTAVVATLIALALSPPAAFGQELVRLGVLLDGPSERSQPLEDEIRAEVTALLASDFDVSFPGELRQEGDWTSDGVGELLDELLARGDVDLLLALGPIAASEAARRDTLSHPVVAPYLIDPTIQSLPGADGTSGRANLNYLTVPNTVPRDLAVLAEVLPLQRVAVLIAEPYTDAIPATTTVAPGTAPPGVTLDLVPVPLTDPGGVIATLASDVDALYVTPMVPLSGAAFGSLLDAAAAAGLPTLSSFGAEDVDAGAFMTLTPPNHNERLARRVALHVQRILLGEPAESLPVSFSRGRRVTINMATARAIGVFPPWSVLTEAELINEPVAAGGRVLTLQAVLEEAPIRSLELQSRNQRVAAAEAGVGTARANLLPRFEASALGTLIDEDRADASFGAAPQRSFAASATVTQVIYSDAAWTGLSVEELSAEAAREERESVRLDVIERAGIAYLNVLRAETLERIQRENLRTTRSFLELAEVREAIGDATPGEIYRWQAQIASDRQRVLAAQAAHDQAATELNRVLNRPLEEPFETAEPDLSDPFFITSDPRLTELTNDPWSFPVFRDFMVQEALRESTELRQLESAIAVRDRVHLSTRRAFWMPDIALQGSFSGRLAEGGAGTEGLTIPASVPNAPDLQQLFPQTDDWNWSLGLQASIPLFTSGARSGEREEALLELRALERDRDELQQRIEQRMRVALLDAGASFPSIDLARQAAGAALRSLELVRDAYTEGVVSIAELLDAQNASLAAEEAAAAAVYDFLIDLMAVERALGRMGFFHSDEREEFFQRAQAFREAAREGNEP